MTKAKKISCHEVFNYSGFPDCCFFEINAREVIIFDSKTGFHLDGVIIKND